MRERKGKEVGLIGKGALRSDFFQSTRARTFWNYLIATNTVSITTSYFCIYIIVAPSHSSTVVEGYSRNFIKLRLQTLYNGTIIVYNNF